MAASTQQAAIGVVSSIEGEVFARNAKGEMRRLARGDSIFEDDVVITASGSSAEITFFDGPGLRVAEQQSVAVDSEVASSAPARDATTGAVTSLGPTEAATAVQVISGAPDFNVLLEEEAAAAGLAGGEGADGGHSFVDLMRIVESVPTVAYSFPTNPTGSAPTLEGEAGAPTAIEPIISVIPDVIVQPPGGVNPPDGGFQAIVSANNAYIPEGTDGDNPHNLVSFIVHLDQAANRDITVSYEILPGTAQPGADYVGTPSSPLVGTVVIPAGATEVAINVDITPDHEDEGPNTVAGAESFHIVLTGATHASINPAANTASGWIVDDDVTQLRLSASPSVSEDGGTVTYTASLADIDGNPVNAKEDVTVMLANGEVITIAANSSSQSIAVAVSRDDVYKESDSIINSISSVGSDGTSRDLIASSSLVTTKVVDDSDVTTVSISTQEVTENDAGVTFAISLSNPPQGAASVSVLVGEATHTVDLDTEGKGSLFLATQDLDPYVDPGSVTATVTAIHGGNFEATSVAGATATARVADVDDVTTVSISTQDVTENDPGVTFTISLSNPPQGAASVSVLVGETIHTVDLDAEGKGSLFLATQDLDPYVDPGSITATVTAIHGGNFEATSVAGATATAQVADVDDVTTVSITTEDVTENDAGVTFAISLSNPPQGAASVSVLVGETTHTVDLDAEGKGSLFLATQDLDPYVDPGSVTATVTAIHGGNFEATSVAGATATARVADVDDVTTVSITTDDVTENDAGVTFAISLSNPPQGAASVSVLVGETIHTVDLDAEGKGSLFLATQDPDPYVDPGSVTATVTAIHGGNFEATSVAGARATAQVVDVDDVTTVSIATEDVTENDPGVTFAISLSNPPQGAASVSVLVGENTYTVDLDAEGKGSLFLATQDLDPYVDPGSVTATVTAIHGGNFEATSVAGASATAQVTDVIDTTHVTLSGNSSVVPGGTITYTVTLDHAVRPGDATVVVALSNGQEITIASGTSASVTAMAPSTGETPSVGPVYIASVTQAPSSGQGAFEHLAAQGSVTTDINYTPQIASSDEQVDETGGLDAVAGTLTVDYGGDAAGTVSLSALAATWVVATNTLTANDGSWKAVVNGDGTYTFTQLKAMIHPDASNDNDAIAINITAHVADADGTAASRSFTVAVHDDGPVITAIQNAIVANQGGTVSGSIDFSFGEDGAASSGALTVVGDDAGGKLNLVYSNDGATVDAYVKNADGSNGDWFYTLTINANGTYGFSYAERPVKENPVDFGTVKGGGGVETVTVTNVAGYGLVLDGLLYQNGVLVNYPAIDDDDIKPQGSGFGVGDSHTDQTKMDNNEGFSIALSGGDPDAEIGIGFDVVQQGSGSQFDINWIAYAAQGGTVLGSGGEHFNLVQSNLPASFAISSEDIDGHATYFEVWFANVVGANVRIEGFSLNEAIVPDDQPLQFSVVAKDADGDPSAAASFNILLSGDGGPGYTLVGDGSDEVFAGGSGNDFFTGGGGADIFAWRLADTPVGTATDKVTDFGTDDALDLRDLVSQGATLDVDNTTHTVTAAYSDTAGVHIQVIEVGFDPGEPIKTLVQTDGVVKIG